MAPEYPYMCLLHMFLALVPLLFPHNLCALTIDYATPDPSENSRRNSHQRSHYIYCPFIILLYS